MNGRLHRSDPTPRGGLAAQSDSLNGFNIDTEFSGLALRIGLVFSL